MTKFVSFYLRIWWIPELGIDDRELFVAGLESIKHQNSRPLHEWCKEVVDNMWLEDYGFDLSFPQQISGEINVSGSTDCFGEYDEDVEFVNVSTERIPEKDCESVAKMHGLLFCQEDCTLIGPTP
jgi:hypothetical protein